MGNMKMGILREGCSYVDRNFSGVFFSGLSQEFLVRLGTPCNFNLVMLMSRVGQPMLS